jgi:multidrug resistance efflux pump
VNLAAAQRRMDRAEKLFKMRLVSASDYETANDEVAIAEIKLHEIEMQTNKPNGQ